MVFGSAWLLGLQPNLPCCVWFFCPVIPAQAGILVEAGGGWGWPPLLLCRQDSRLRGNDGRYFSIAGVCRA
ncbi:hypothetical protein HMPREF9123_1033 [Neisseria bacilliformis ATCC BAA-1200]|uniref:Uncharacterized protein n=1 Tax=Neisseria bacilliformis ATCC BAA-1200 TaxID=888742 RepID=F2BBC8_9NEIS|nr:hypothetical protein HMPREF9123_1033 [Neisseria bacilliformis ATCC BAA-1200]